MTELLAALSNRVKGIEELPSDALQAIASQTALIAALAADPHTGAPSFWYGNANKAVVYPCVTFRFSGGLPDPRFWDGTLSVDDVFLDMDIWEDKGVAATITEIDKHLRRLFDEVKGAPELLLENDLEAVSMTVFTGLTTSYDPGRNAWFGMRRWKVTVID